MFDYFDSEEWMKELEKTIRRNHIKRENEKIRRYNRILLFVWSMFCLSVLVTGYMIILEYWN